MNRVARYPRILYGCLFLIVLVLEIGIALFVRDTFIRPYVGDVLVTVCIGCFLRSWKPQGMTLLAVWIFLLSAAVEIGQYFDFVSLLGVDHIPFLRILLGTTFSVPDLFCYAFGCLIFYWMDRAVQKRLDQTVKTGYAEN